MSGEAQVNYMVRRNVVTRYTDHFVGQKSIMGHNIVRNKKCLAEIISNLLEKSFIIPDLKQILQLFKLTLQEETYPESLSRFILKNCSNNRNFSILVVDNLLQWIYGAQYGSAKSYLMFLN